MKKLLLVALLAIGVSAASYAQGGPGGGGMRGGTPDEQVERLKTSITGLNADQATKIKAIYVAQAKSQDSLMAAAGDDRMAAFQKLTPIRTANQAKIKALLTADQQKAWDALPQNQPRGQGGPGGGMGGPPRN